MPLMVQNGVVVKMEPNVAVFKLGARYAEIEETWTTGARCRIDADVQGGNDKRYVAMPGARFRVNMENKSNMPKRSSKWGGLVVVPMALLAGARWKWGGLVVVLMTKTKRKKLLDKDLLMVQDGSGCRKKMPGARFRAVGWTQAGSWREDAETK